MKMIRADKKTGDAYEKGNMAMIRNKEKAR